jgi:uncharacterized protein YcaQ
VVHIHGSVLRRVSPAGAGHYEAMTAERAVHRLTLRQARRIAIRAQVLDAARPRDVVALVQRLGLLQLEPTAPIAPSADVVCWSRLGPGYRPDDLVVALEIDRTLFELDLLSRPMTDVALYLAAARDPRARQERGGWMEANERFRADVLELLAREGPLSAREIPDTALVPWRSSGWNNNRNVQMMLQPLMMRCEVAVSGRDGNDRLWDLAERVYPQVEIPRADVAQRRRNERRLSSLGIARAKATKMPTEPVDVGDVGEPAVVEGVRGAWRVDPAYLDDDDDFAGRTALLSPLDRLVFDRKRLLELFEFEYTLEQYKPATKRRWGYWAMPILHGDRFVGKLDATADRRAGVLFVDAVHEDVPFTRVIRRAIDTEIESLMAWLDLHEIVRPR